MLVELFDLYYPIPYSMTAKIPTARCLSVDATLLS